MDKASILGDAIDYVKELQGRLRAMQDDPLRVAKAATDMTTTREDLASFELEQGREGDEAVEMKEVAHGRHGTNIRVSMETDNVALVKLHCPWRQTLLVDVLQTLNEFEFEVSAVRSSTSDGIFSALLQAKVGAVQSLVGYLSFQPNFLFTVKFSFLCR